MEAQNSLKSFTGEKIYVGLDVHKRSWQVCTSVNGVLQRPFHMSPANAQILKAYLDRHYPGGIYRCGYEAGFCGFWIQETLSAVGIETVVLHAADIPSGDKDRRQKTDKRDSIRIVKALGQGLCEGIYVPSRDIQQVRSLVRHRSRVVRDRCRVMVRIKSHLDFYGISDEAPRGCSVWSRRYVNFLKEEAAMRQDKTLESLIEYLKSLRQVELGVLRAMRSLSKSAPYSEASELVQSIPGIGLISSMILLTEIGLDTQRFSTFDKLCFYCGLVPDTNSSGERQVVKEMTRRGNRRLRTTLIECAWSAISADAELGLCYSRYLKKGMLPQKSIVKIARKLLSIVRHVLKTKKKYTKNNQPNHNTENQP